jgi:predicted metal-dependent enzyme (double-stranded beta helix superfamily)
VLISTFEEELSVFDKTGFIQECIDAIPDGQLAIREIVMRAVAEPGALMAGLGEPVHAGIEPLYRSKELTILNFAWAPHMSLMPHNHQMFALIGIYAGREDNIFWRRKGALIEAAGARSLGVGDVATLGEDVIHSVLNPTGKMTCALHVYGGDFFEPDEPRSEWDPETLDEQRWEVERVKRLFQEAEERFNAVNQQLTSSLK